MAAMITFGRHYAGYLATSRANSASDPMSARLVEQSEGEPASRRSACLGQRVARADHRRRPAANRTRASGGHPSDAATGHRRGVRPRPDPCHLRRGTGGQGVPRRSRPGSGIVQAVRPRVHAATDRRHHLCRARDDCRGGAALRDLAPGAAHDFAQGHDASQQRFPEASRGHPAVRHLWKSGCEWREPSVARPDAAEGRVTVRRDDSDTRFADGPGEVPPVHRTLPAGTGPCA